MEINKKKKIYVAPQYVPVVFRVSDIVVASGGTGEHDIDIDGSASANSISKILRNLDNSMPF